MKTKPIFEAIYYLNNGVIMATTHSPRHRWKAGLPVFNERRGIKTRARSREPRNKIRRHTNNAIYRDSTQVHTRLATHFTLSNPDVVFSDVMLQIRIYPYIYPHTYIHPYTYIYSKRLL